MITLDPAAGYEAPEERLVIYSDPFNGRLYELSILALVVLNTVKHLESIGLDMTDADNVEEHSPEIAELLVLGGWFTEDEYIRAVARSESEDIDDELKDLLG